MASPVHTFQWSAGVPRKSAGGKDDKDEEQDEKATACNLRYFGHMPFIAIQKKEAQDHLSNSQCCEML